MEDPGREGRRNDGRRERCIARSPLTLSRSLHPAPGAFELQPEPWVRPESGARSLMIEAACSAAATSNIAFDHTTFTLK